MSCGYCRSMAGYSLPGHRVEVLTLATSEADELGIDRDVLRAAVVDRLERLVDHSILGSSWGQLGFVRLVARDVDGEAVDMAIWRANLRYWSTIDSRSDRDAAIFGRRERDAMTS